MLIAASWCAAVAGLTADARRCDSRDRAGPAGAEMGEEAVTEVSRGACRAASGRQADGTRQRKRSTDRPKASTSHRDRRWDHMRWLRGMR